MDVMWIAIAVDMLLYASIGAAIGYVGRRSLPPPWNQMSFTVTVAIVVGALITLATFTNWAVFPR